MATAMQRLIYVSKVARQIRFSDVEAIAEHSAMRNRVSDLTGLLIYTPSHFIQVLEGPADAVRNTLIRIQRDERHTDLRVIERVPIGEREFAKWAMKASMLPAGVSALDFDYMDREAALKVLRACL